MGIQQSKCINSFASKTVISHTVMLGVCVCASRFAPAVFRCIRDASHNCVILVFLYKLHLLIKFNEKIHLSYEFTEHFVLHELMPMLASFHPHRGHGEVLPPAKLLMLPQRESQVAESPDGRFQQ